MRRPDLGSLGNKLALIFAAITALAVGVVFFLVVPQLQSRLEGQKLDDLERVARESSGTLQSVMGREIPAERLDQLVRAVADAEDAQVTLLGVQRSGGARPEGRALSFYVISDSRALQRVEVDRRLAGRAVAADRIETATGTAGGREVGEAARPLRYRGRADWVAVYTRQLDDVAETVGLIRNRVLLASLAALLLALGAGYFVARALARRVRRLETAAREVAAGRFVAPLPVDSDDELGQLTRAFNQMQQQLARVDRARREFIANASHELRTPIFSLGGFVELLQDEDLDEATREEFLASMREQVDRLQKLAVDLLDLSRLDAGSLELHPEQVDLSRLARGVVSEFTPAVAQHETDLELHLPEERIDAVCDRERVAQIMRILLDNAIQHTPDGTRVTVAAERRNGGAEFRVADRGPGVDGESADQLFERFYTADAARGSGLGLAIAKELAEHMHGRIRLDSERGETVFTLALPTPESGR